MIIDKRHVGQEFFPLIIAEIGINHGGNLDVAKKIVDSAHLSGCEIIKHQTHFIEDEMTEEAMNIIPPNASKSIWDLMDECSLSPDEELLLKEHVESLNMIYLSTPFSRKAADFLNEIGVHAFKIGSGECTHVPLIRHICGYGKPIIMSTGMQSIQSLENSVSVLDESNISYALLECTNLYPSPPDNVSLKGLFELKNNFRNAIIGFSDHSIGPEMALASVALGASIIERHFTDSRYRKGPDISCSMDPAELKYLIDRSKEIYIATRNSKVRSKEEESVYIFARPSVVANKNLYPGHIITEDDIWAKRPGNGEIGVEDFYKLIGKKVNKYLKINQQLKWSDFSNDSK